MVEGYWLRGPFFWRAGFCFAYAMEQNFHFPPFDGLMGKINIRFYMPSFGL
jgi:hypothetical protein